MQTRITDDNTCRALRQFSIMLIVAAAWNLVGAALVFANLSRHIALFFGRNAVIDDPIAMLNTIGFWGSVVLFGIGYLIVAANPAKNHGIIFLAIIGKVAVFLIWTWYWWRGYATALALFGGVGDLIFAVLLMFFLLRIRKLTA